jgi:peptidoglycan/LPS O-acetylase OafA/YrhL
MQKHRNWIRAAFVILAAGMVGLTIFSHLRGTATLYTFEMATFGFSWIALFCACLILLVAASRFGMVARLTRVPLLRHFGLIAYGMFLFNLPVYTFMQGLLSGKSTPDIGNFKDVLAALLAFFITWILAALSWRYFEKPIVSWGHSFSYMPKEIVPIAQTIPTATVP